MSISVRQALQGFVQRYIELNGNRLLGEFDAQWLSPCELGAEFTQADGTQVAPWAPMLRAQDQALDEFAGLENALETTVHPDFKAFFGSYWSGHLEASATDGHVSLLQLWNDEDRARLIENQLGHYLTQRRAQRKGRGAVRVSLFVACTEPDSDLILTLDNQTGVVLLEQPGKPPLRQVSESLAEFIQTLAPAPHPAV